MNDDPAAGSGGDVKTRPPVVHTHLRLLGPKSLGRILRLGIKSLWLHRLRSMLTALGIVFGVSSVISMLAIGEGASHEAQEQIKNLGSQNIILRSVKPSEERKLTEQANQSYILQYGITSEDLKRIRETIPDVVIVVPARVMREYVWNGNRQVDCDIFATVPWYPDMRNHHVNRGRFFSQQDMDACANVCVIGAEMVDQLFPLDPAIGSDVRVGSDYYRVIGVMEPRSKGAKVEETSDSKSAANRMFIPLDTALTRYGEVLSKQRQGSFEAERVALHELTIKVTKPELVIPVSGAIANVMDRNHKKRDYEMIVPLELLKRAERTKQIFNIVLGSIAAISLLVGGIGIMNIMLASVTERTQEIGIRRALGAKREDIVIQFLVETVMLSGSGGVIGVALGMAVPWFVTYFAGMETIITFWSPVAAFSISGLVGVVFGLYPAVVASRMDPVEALRHA